MIRHVVLLRWRDGTTPSDVNAVSEGLGGLPAAIPEIREYRFGHDLGLNQGNFDYVVVADFASVDDYLAYRDHPVHRAVIDERITPILDGRAAIQYEAGERSKPA